MIPARLMALARHPIVTLVCTRGLGQAAVLASTFWLARLVTPGVYGELGLFTSFCALISMASGARFEIRALVCRTEGARRKFVAMAYAANAAIFLIVLPLCIVTTLSGMAPAWTVLLPLGVVLSSLVNYVFPSQNSSPGQLAKLGRMNVVVSVSTAVLQIIAAKIAPLGVSLIVARLIAWLAGVAAMRSDLGAGLRSMRALRKREAFRIYKSSRQEIFYGTSSALLGVMELQCAVYVLSFFMQQNAVGLYWMGFNLLFVPFFVVSGSVRPLFLRHLATARKSTDISRLMLRYIGISLAAGVAFVIPLVFAAALATRTFLGPEWQGVQYFASLLGFTLVILIARLPISFAASALRLQRLNLAFGVLQISARVVSLALPLYMGTTVLTAMKWFTFAASSCYVAHIGASLYAIRRVES